ncbi:hypothetical protein M758_1G137900 [Ceratodon purpureus]|nr:hypothetical protein M758_1G137900 [Ceratodon purpureus]
MTDEAADADVAPRDGDERTERAVQVMVNTYGLDRDLVIKTLKKLYKVFYGAEEWWGYVELENYHMLLDEVLNLQSKQEARRARAAAAAAADTSGDPPDDTRREPPDETPSDTSERPKRNGDHSQSSPPRVTRVNGYEERSATALKVLATDLIRKEEEAGRRQMQMDGKTKLSLLHSRGGLTPRTDGRGVKLIDSAEYSTVRKKPDDNIAHKKLKQPKEEFEPHNAPTTSRRQLSNSQSSKKLKRQRQETDECRRELQELVGDVGEEAHGQYRDGDHIDRGQCRHDVNDLSRGFEAIPIPIVNQSNSKTLPSSFFYIDKSRPYEKGFVNTAISRIGDDDCCPSCYKDCLSAPHLCACVRETGGNFAYTLDGCLDRRYIDQYMKVKHGLASDKLHFCESGYHCPHERHKNYENPAACKGHPVRDFVKECSSKCGCSKQCGNRVVQRGISRRLEVFMTPEGKGWGIRTLEDLPAGAFAFEYIGEILTNTEMWERNNQVHANGGGFHTYPLTLDGDWGSEANLKDEEALCLDATFFGNVARFLNHRCLDANLMNMPVEIETPDRHYYHVAFFTNRRVKAKEELTWDYGIDFDDDDHPVPAFSCLCGSEYCRGSKPQ